VVTRGLADTTIFIPPPSAPPPDETSLPAELAVSVITVGELRAAVLFADDVRVRDRRLAAFAAATALDPVPIDDEVATQWSRLRGRLRDTGQHMPLNDSWVAATAMALGVPVVTRSVNFVDLDEPAIVRV
jgi:predicted nucleic acid-binding protein